MSKNQNGGIMYTLLSIILVALEMIMILKPEFFYEITESWENHTGGTPSICTFFVRGWAV